MAVQRLVPEAERRRRLWGGRCIGVALVLGAGLGWAVVLWGGINAAGLVLVAFLVGLIAWGLHLALRPRVVVEVELDDRTYTVIRGGTRQESGRLDALGPLAVTMRTRRGPSRGRGRFVAEYVVSPAGHPDLDFFVTDTAGKARQRMEKVARAWRLSCRSFEGSVREADDLDRPLHERLRGDREARSVMSLSPEWNLRIERLSPGYVIVSTHRSRPLVAVAIALLLALLVLGITPATRVLSSLREGGSTVLQQGLVGAMSVLALGLLWHLWRVVRDVFFPGTLRITERGVSYRGSRMAFDEIEEVPVTLPIEMVGDRRTLRLAESFCPPAAKEALVHEIQRLILEVATTSSSGV
jgi:hypothetical protein